MTRGEQVSAPRAATMIVKAPGWWVVAAAALRRRATTIAPGRPWPAAEAMRAFGRPAPKGKASKAA